MLLVLVISLGFAVCICMLVVNRLAAAVGAGCLLLGVDLLFFAALGCFCFVNLVVCLLWF